MGLQRQMIEIQNQPWAEQFAEIREQLRCLEARIASALPEQTDMGEMLAGIDSALEALEQQSPARERVPENESYVSRRTLREHEQALDHQSQITQTITDNATAALFMIDADGYCTFMNPAAERMTGYSWAEASGRILHDLIHHTRHEGTPLSYEDCPLRQALPRNYQLRAHEDSFVRKDGSFVPVLCSASPIIRDGEPVGTVIEARDLTEIKQAEAALHETAERYRLVALATNDVIWDWNVVTDEIQWNEAIETVFGHRPKDWIGSGQWWKAHIHPDDRERVLRRIHGVIDGDQSAWAEEYRFQRSDGAYATVYDRGYVYRVEGQPLRMIGSMLDLTERTRADQERAEWLERERTARAEAEAAVRARDVFMSVAAHELNTPITSLRGFAQLLLRQVAGGRPLDMQRLERSLQTIDKQSAKLGKLVSQLLDVSRIESGRLSLTKAPTDLARLVHEVTANLQATTTDHTLTVLSPPAVFADVDPLRFEQVLTNLIGNAIKYSPDGGPVTIAITQASPDFLEIRVADRGLGVAPEHRPHIFDRFYQAHAGNHFGGMGLGLFISRQIVGLHGGQLIAEFPPEGGTCFVVQLPTTVERFDRLPEERGVC